MNSQNKKLIIAALAIIAVLTGGAFLLDWKGISYEKKGSENQPQSISVKDIDRYTDTDHDGLPDWKEKLWGTDLNKADTDGDGTTDGEEVSNNRNPLIKGPNDSILETISFQTKDTNSSEPDTFTNELSRQLFSQIILNKTANNGTLSKEASEQIVSQFIASLDHFSEIEPKYTEKNILISSKNTEEATQIYGDTLASIIKKYFDPITESEMKIFKTALENEDALELEKLKPISLAYQNVAQEMLAMEAPKDLFQDHLNVINAFQQIGQELEDMQKSFTDPTVAIIAIKQYQTSAANSYVALKNMNLYFTGHAIIFNSNGTKNLFALYK